MVNYRMEDVHALVKALREEGCNVLEEITLPSTGNLPGSSTQRETRSNRGSRFPVNERQPPPSAEAQLVQGCITFESQ